MTDQNKNYQELHAKVEARFKELKDKWHTPGKEVWKIYTGQAEHIPFNILYSNTETIVPAVFSRKPLPRVTRRFDDSRADMPAKVVQRYLSYAMDTNLPSYPSFMTAIEDSVLDAALPGQGIFRVRNHQGISVLDYVEWDKFVWGYCSRWESCPWIGFAHDMEPEEVLEQFKDKLSAEQQASFKLKAKESATDDGNEKGPSGEELPSTVRIWEIWKKKDRSRCWLSDCAENFILARDEDPLRLENFFPVPKPLNFLHATTDTMPKPLYRLYQSQAEELNEITQRLKVIVRALKVRGIYASVIDDIPKVFAEDDDNVLVPSSAAFNLLAQGKGLEAYIWLLPIEKLILVAKELYGAREAVKGTIYEILGIGDILRGVSKASETLGAQQIKDKWGSLRINKMRERTTEFVRDGLRLLAECAAKNTPPEIWEKATGVGLMPPMQAALQAQAGKPPQKMETWEGVLELLRDDLTRSYTIDIETNSSVDSSATEEKSEMAEFMNALGQAMAGLKDLMTSPQGWQAGIAIMQGIVSKFDLGEEIAPLLKGLPPPAALNGPPPELQQMQQEIEQRAQELQKREQALIQDEQTLAATLGDAEKASQALAQQRKEIQAAREQMRRDTEAAIKEIDFARREASLKLKEEKMAVDAAKVAVQAQAKANNQPKKPSRPA